RSRPPAWSGDRAGDRGRARPGSPRRTTIPDAGRRPGVVLWCGLRSGSLPTLLDESANERLGVGLEHPVDLLQQRDDLVVVGLGRRGSGGRGLRVVVGSAVLV